MPMPLFRTRKLNSTWKVIAEQHERIYQSMCSWSQHELAHSFDDDDDDADDIQTQSTSFTHPTRRPIHKTCLDSVTRPSATLIAINGPGCWFRPGLYLKFCHTRTLVILASDIYIYIYIYMALSGRRTSQLISLSSGLCISWLCSGFPY